MLRGKFVFVAQLVLAHSNDVIYGYFGLLSFTVLMPPIFSLQSRLNNQVIYVYLGYLSLLFLSFLAHPIFFSVFAGFPQQTGFKESAFCMYLG